VKALCVDPSIVVPAAAAMGNGVSGMIVNQCPLKPASLVGMLKMIVLPELAFAVVIAARNEPGPPSLVVVTTSGALACAAATASAAEPPAPPMVTTRPARIRTNGVRLSKRRA
jgi:hypothetical protein